MTEINQSVLTRMNMDKVNGLIVVILVAIVAVLSGCSSQTGFDFHFGITPVNSTDHRDQLLPGDNEASKNVYGAEAGKRF